MNEAVKDVVSCHKTFQCSKLVQAFLYISLPLKYYGVLQYKQMSFVECTDPDEAKEL